MSKRLGGIIGCKYVIQKVQDTVIIHLEVDEEQSGGRSHKEVRGKPSRYGPHVRTMSGLRLADTPHAQHQHNDPRV